MARMPGAEWVGEHGSALISRHDIVCVHTIVGYAPAHAAHFSVHHDGRIQQSRDTRYKSAANWNGNYRVIAIENEDHGSAFGSWSGSNVPALTDAQVAANAKILKWAHETHGVPLQLCPNSRPESRGLAYHRQGIDGNFGDYDYPGRVSGGEVWTQYPGKVCPGDRRISQLPDILARARGQSTQREDDDMMKYGDSALHIRAAGQTLNWVLRNWRGDDGRVLDQGNEIDVGWDYNDSMRGLVRYLLVNVLGVSDDNAPGTELHSAQLSAMITRVKE